MFFFQAEDGIRDIGVTGVQTCALPISGEMPASWNIEALKAQAVAARSYALATRKTGLFDQYPDTRSQVYRGVAGEQGSSSSRSEERRVGKECRSRRSPYH